MLFLYFCKFNKTSAKCFIYWPLNTAKKRPNDTSIAHVIFILEIFDKALKKWLILRFVALLKT